MVQLGHGPGCVTSLHELPHLRICQLLRCLVFVCATTAACSSSTSTPATQTPIFNGLVGIRLAGLMLTFCWYTPWGATGAADGAGAGVGAGPGRGARGARGGPGEPLITNQSPAKLLAILDNPEASKLIYFKQCQHHSGGHKTLIN